MNNEEQWKTVTVFLETHSISMSFSLKDWAMIYDELDSIAGKASVNERMRLMNIIKANLGDEFIQKILLHKQDPKEIEKIKERLIKNGNMSDGSKHCGQG